MSDNLQPPDQEEVERAVRDLFKDGDIKETAKHSRVPYGTLTKKLNPNDTTESVVYEFLMFLYGSEMAREGLGEAVWKLLALLRPRRTKPALTMNSFEATYFDLRATLARREDGHATEEEVEAAKARHAEATARVGAGRQAMNRAARERESSLAG